MFRLATAVAIVSLAACFLFPGHPADAGDLRVIRGIVGSVSGNLIYLNGKSIDLTGVAIQHPSGKEASLSEIRPGTQVGLFYRRGTLVSVLVYPAMLE